VRGKWSSDETLSKNRLVASITLTKKFGDLSVDQGKNLLQSQAGK